MKTVGILAGILWELLKFSAKEFGLLFLGFLCGGLSVACYAKLGFWETMGVIFPDMALVFIGGIVGAIFGTFLLCLWRVLKEKLQSRQELVEQHYAAAIDGQVFFRAVLHVPREWLQLPKEEEHRRARAQLKGQGPF